MLASFGSSAYQPLIFDNLGLFSFARFAEGNNIKLSRKIQIYDANSIEIIVSRSFNFFSFHSKLWDGQVVPSSDISRNSMLVGVDENPWGVS